MADINYCLYARKSTESDELQALSIDSQIKEMLDQAKRDGIEVTKIRRESHSAKQSFTRPVFLKLMEDIRNGRFGGILTWAPDRLSRNAGDLGALVDQLVSILDKVDIEKLAVENRFTEDLIRYRGFMKSVLKQSDDAVAATDVDIRDYAKHILMTGKREDKQAIMACVTTTLYLKSKTIRIRKPRSVRF